MLIDIAYEMNRKKPQRCPLLFYTGPMVSAGVREYIIIQYISKNRTFAAAYSLQALTVRIMETE
jgi:hypothetical protein